ncbi:hypothetical protein [Glutamicibacter sp.]|nr:hypothetical protein [Glutamicibacter sp.]HJX78511.1 hypothetical protein [Glutamicibacter sp.]
MNDNQKLMLIAGVVFVVFIVVMMVLTSGVSAFIFDPEPEATLRQIFSTV